MSIDLKRDKITLCAEKEVSEQTEIEAISEQIAQNRGVFESHALKIYA